MWLLFVVLASFFFAIVSLVDKYVLTNMRVKPAVLTFYIGALGMLVFLLTPFIGFAFPLFPALFLAVGAGALFSLALLVFFRELGKHEASRLVPAVNAFVPLLMLVFIFVLSKGQAAFSALEFAAFALLIAGTIFISQEKASHTKESVTSAFLVGLLFAFSFVAAKYAYEGQSFWNVFMTMRFGGLAVSLALLSLQEVRNEIFGRGQKGSGISFWEMPKNYAVFLAGQASGALGEVFRNGALFLVPFAMLPFVNALQGLQYVFLLAFASLLSWKFPHILREEISKSSLFQKAVSILLIGAGLALLALA